MRGIESSVAVRLPVREVWARIARPQGLQALSEAFGGWGSKFRYEVENDAPLGHGASIAVFSRWNRPVARWQVSGWNPPHELEMVAVDEDRILSSYQLTLTIRLNAEDDDLTQVSVSFVLVFLNKLLEAFSLVLPLRPLYARRLNRALLLFREACRRPVA